MQLFTCDIILMFKKHYSHWVLIDAFNTPPKSFVLFYTHAYLKMSLPNTGGVLWNIIIKTPLINNLLSKVPLKTGYIHLIENKQTA